MDTAFVMDATIYAVLNTAVLIMAILVLFMQPGFILYEAGSISRLNTINDIYKNFLSLCFGGVGFLLLGWDIINGKSFLTPWLVEIGLANPPGASRDENTMFPNETIAFLFQMGFATTAAAICAGAVTGRIRPHVYVAFAAAYAGITYPLIAFTVWNPQGLLYEVFTDFAGSVVVHSSGAAAGLAATILLRPRIGFNGYDPIGLGRDRLFRIAKRHAPHNIPLATFGAILLWVGWFGLTCGSLLVRGVPTPSVYAGEFIPVYVNAIGETALTTILAPASAAVTVTFIQIAERRYGDILETMGGLIAGAVSIGAGANLYDPFEAIAVGACAGIVYKLTRILFERLNIDDPIANIASHGFTGILGVTAVAFFKPHPDPFMLAGWQASVGLALFATIFLMSLIFFTIVSTVFSLIERLIRAAPEGPRPSAMRVAYRTEVLGIDASLYGLDAYNFGAKE